MSGNKCKQINITHICFEKFGRAVFDEYSGMHSLKIGV